MAPVLKITNVTYVAATAGALPSEPSIKLNPMEAQWVLVLLLQHRLLFGGDHLPPFDAILQSLRPSVVTTRPPMPHLQHYLADTGNVAICCSTGGGGNDNGVRFVAVECDVDVRRLASDGDHDVLTFKRLVLELDMSLLLTPLLAVQATCLAIADGPML